MIGSYRLNSAFLWKRRPTSKRRELVILSQSKRGTISFGHLIERKIPGLSGKANLIFQKICLTKHQHCDDVFLPYANQTASTALYSTKPRINPTVMVFLNVNIGERSAGSQPVLSSRVVCGRSMPDFKRRVVTFDTIFSKFGTDLYTLAKERSWNGRFALHP